MVAAPRTALLAGATGLVGRSLLSLLLASDRYRSLHVLLRRTPPDIKVSAKLKLHVRPAATDAVESRLTKAPFDEPADDGGP